MRPPMEDLKSEKEDCGLTFPGEIDGQYGTRVLEGAVLEGTGGRAV